MSNLVKLPVGLQLWPAAEKNSRARQEGYELSLLEDCDNAYRLTVAVDVNKVARLLKDFTRFLPEDAFFILEFYPEESLMTRPSCNDEQLAPEVFYSPYLPTAEILASINPYLDRMIHDGFVGFGIANNRRGLELFYSEEKVMTFFTDNHLRLCNFLKNRQIPHLSELILPADLGHDHLALTGLPRHQLPPQLRGLSDKQLDSCVFCQELVDELDMYPVEEGLSFFLTRKEQEQIAQLMKLVLPDDELAEVEFGSLLLDWSDFVTECVQAFEGDLWEYRQGLRVRDTIQSVIEAAPQDLAEKISSIVQEPDTDFQNALIDRRKRLDPPSSPVLQQERFWYQGMVRNQGTFLRRDLIRQGWFSG